MIKCGDSSQINSNDDRILCVEQVTDTPSETTGGEVVAWMAVCAKTGKCAGQIEESREELEYEWATGIRRGSHVIVPLYTASADDVRLHAFVDGALWRETRSDIPAPMDRRQLAMAAWEYYGHSEKAALNAARATKENPNAFVVMTADFGDVQVNPD